MVGANLLLTIHHRPCDITATDEPFGGLSVLCVGDLMQLPPVAERAVYKQPNDPLTTLYGSLWHQNFHIILFELTEVMRQ